MCFEEPSALSLLWAILLGFHADLRISLALFALVLLWAISLGFHTALHPTVMLCVCFDLVLFRTCCPLV